MLGTNIGLILKRKLRYEHPQMNLEREWKALLDDAKEKTLRKEENTLPNPPRYVMR